LLLMLCVELWIVLFVIVVIVNQLILIFKSDYSFLFAVITRFTRSFEDKQLRFRFADTY